MSTSDFPAPFTGRLELKGGDLAAHPSFIVASMFTPSYRNFATRLAVSLNQFQLPYVMYEVPAVHHSISPKGNEDEAHTKANFINFVLDCHRTPVLYVDCDCVFRAEPKRISTLVADGFDFAIYNWLADEHTDAFKPCRLSTSDGPVENSHRRFFLFDTSFDWFAPEQLQCAGAVQFYSTTPAARGLLAAWNNTIRDFPGVLDDPCLEYAFNFNPSMTKQLHTSWLDKSYARCLFWIYVRPVIDHPQIATPLGIDTPTIEAATGKPRWKSDHAEVRADGRLFPRDALIDAVKRQIWRCRDLKPANGRLEFDYYAPLSCELFIS
jgi:hypothetical protein